MSKSQGFDLYSLSRISWFLIEGRHNNEGVVMPSLVQGALWVQL